MTERNQTKKGEEISSQFQKIHNLTMEIKSGLEQAGVQNIQVEHSSERPGEVAFIRHPRIGGDGTNTITVELTNQK